MNFSAQKLYAFYGKAAALIVLILLSSCSDRERQNPLDPQNPDTQGKPVGLSVVSLLDTIHVSWQPMRLQDLTGYLIYRRLAGEPDFSLLAEVPASADHYQELSNRFGVLHSYRIVAHVGELTSPPSEEETTTPGPTVAWIADLNDGSLLKLTHDGRHALLRTFAFPSPLRVKVDGKRGNVWVLDELTGNFGRVNQAGGDRQIYERFGKAVDLALDYSDGSIWVADTLGKGLWRYDASGVLLVKNESLSKLAALAINPFYSELWAITQDGRELLRISKQAVLLQRVPLPVTVEDRPLDLGVHAATGTAWLSLGRRVMRLNAAGEVLSTSTHAFRRALRLAVDQSTAECWVIDESFAFRDSRVFRLDAQGAVQFQFEGFDRPQNLAVNPFDSSCYIVDSLRSRIVRISKQGELQTVFAALITPIDIDIVSLVP